MFKAKQCKKLGSTPWSCGQIRHVLDREVRGLNLTVAKTALDGHEKEVFIPLE